jgi:hypothetical protein
MRCKTNFINGIPLFNPNKTLPWKQNENDIFALFSGEKIEKITNDYYTILTNVFHEDFTCNIGFHFKSKMLYKLEFFRTLEYFENKDIYDSYIEFQAILNNFFGVPTKEKSQYCNLWKLGFIEVSHCIYERFYLEEHVEINIL